MAAFPRVIGVARATALRLAGDGYLEVGNAGTNLGRARAVLGWRWTEVIQTHDGSSRDGRALQQAVMQYLRTKEAVDVQAVHVPKNNAQFTGNVTVNGAGQTGSSIVVVNSVSGQSLAYRGDWFQIAGVTGWRRASGDFSASPGTGATMLVEPPVYAGQAPANGAAVAFALNASPTFACRLVEAIIPQFGADQLVIGMTLTWQEVV